MKCPNCGHENPDIRLFCARCGEILPEKDGSQAEERPVSQGREASPFQRQDDLSFDDGLDFHRRREHARRVIDETWPEAAGAADDREIHGTSADGQTGTNRRSEPRDVNRIFDDERNPNGKAAVSRNNGRDFDDPWLRPVHREKPESPRTSSGGHDFEVRRNEREYEAPSVKREASRPDTYIPRREEELDPDSFFEINEKKPPFEKTSRVPEDDFAPKPRPDTFIPQRGDDIDPEDLFAVRGRSASFDRLDEKPRRKRLKGDEFEDSDGQSFVMRHMRGIVSLALLMFTLAIVVIWAITPGAQLTLAKLDLAWDASAYEELGDAEKAKENYSSAAHYYEKALEKDEDNILHAHNAADSWLCAENYDMAAKALRKCIEIEPNTAVYYIRLMEIFDGYENLPESDRILVDDGYRRTGDSRLDYKTLED